MAIALTCVPNVTIRTNPPSPPHPCRWDKPHKIELAMNEVRKSTSPKVAFYISLSGKVAEAQAKYLHGKGFERVTVAWEKLKLRMGSIGT
eukprot:6434179-Prymnesium_polylepis.2